MKWLLMTAILVSANAFAADGQPEQTFSATCNLSDLQKSDDGINVITKKYDFKMDETIPVIEYNGHKYEIAIFNLSYENKVRYEINLAARDSKTNAVIGSASATFSKEVPDVIFQDGPNIILDCMQLN